MSNYLSYVPIPIINPLYNRTDTYEQQVRLLLYFSSSPCTCKFGIKISHYYIKSNIEWLYLYQQCNLIWILYQYELLTINIHQTRCIWSHRLPGQVLFEIPVQYSNTVQYSTVQYMRIRTKYWSSWSP